MAAEINLGALSGSGYLVEEALRAEGNRNVYRYNLPVGADAARAAAAIEAFLAANPGFFFLSRPASPTSLQHIVHSHRFLVINGQSVCLSNKGKAPAGLDNICKDLFFSESVIEEPVQCCLFNHHIFERSYIVAYLALRGNTNCPCSGTTPHLISTMDVDPFVQRRLQGIFQTFNDNVRFLKEAQERADKNEAERVLQQTRNNALVAARRPDRNVELSTGGGKIAYQICVTAAHYVEPGAQLLSSAGKAIPGISLGFGIFLACYRTYQGYQTNNREEYYKAALEIVAGVAGCFPGIGSGVSIAVNAGIGGHDIWGGGKVQENVLLAGALQTFGLRADPPPTRVEIDAAHRRYSALTHPDKMRQYGPVNERELTNLQTGLNQSRDFLIAHYGY